MPKKSFSIFLLLVATVFLITGCSGPFSLGPSDYIALLASDEMLRTEVANANLKALNEEYEVYDLNEGNFYYDTMKDLEKNTESNLDFKLHYIPSEVVNAFYVGDGHIVLFDGLLDILTEKQAPAVIAHEMAHGTNNHIVENVRSQVGYKITNDILAEMDINKTARGIGLFFLKNGFSREDEKEADLSSLKILENSNYNPYLTIEVMEELDRLQGNMDAKLLEIFQTHPLPKTRISYINKELENIY